MNKMTGGNENCSLCENTVGGENGIKCEGLCQNVYHIKCVRLQVKDILALKNIKGAKWFCDKCLPLLDCTFNWSKDLNEFKKSIKDELENLKKTINVSETMKTEKTKIEHSYAKVVAGEAIVIKPKTKQESSKTKEAVKKNVNPAVLSVGITQMKNIKDGGILLKCKTKEEIDKVKKAAEKSLGKNYQVKVPNQRKPCVKIIDIDEEYKDEELINAIKKQNAHIRHRNMELRVVVFKKMKTRYQAIIECDPTTFNNIIKEEHISIGYMSCRVHEYVRIYRCFKCGGFNHKADECVSDIKCLNCGSNEHTREECENAVKCGNCVSANKTLGLDNDVNHSVFDVSKCPILQRKINNEKQKIATNDADE